MNTAILTIDDIASKNTPAIVDYLKGKGIRAIMFAEGARVERFYEEALYAVKNGMIVGNHSYSHPAFSSILVEDAIEEIEKCEQVLDKLYADAGVERRFRPFRFPYGDKGAEKKEALQRYLIERGFHKVDDRQIPYQWWKDYGMDKDVDTFWTFDFEEYRLQYDAEFTKQSIWDKMNNTDPQKGTLLFAEENKHIILLHAHDETDNIYPQYYKEFIDCCLDRGLQFEEPRFLKMDNGTYKELV